MSGVRLEGIGKSYGVGGAVLRDVTIDVAAGEFLTLLGPSGCGKSTLLRLVAGLERQDAGGVWISGRCVDGLPPRERDIAMVFQSHALYPHLTVRENLALPLRMRRLAAHQRIPLLHWLMPGARAVRRQIDLEVQAAAVQCKVEHLLERHPEQLSGGQRQRVALGRAMVRSPAVFLMDEPLSSLDASLRVAMRAEIKSLHRRLGVTFIYVTHDHIEAMTMSDRIGVLLDGTLQQIGRPHEVYADPASLAVAQLLGAPKINTLEAHAIGNRQVQVGASILPIVLPLPAGTQVTVAIRPESLKIGGRAQGVLPGRILLIEDHGCDRYVYVEMQGVDRTLVARVDSQLASTCAIGDNVGLSVAPQDALLFAENGARLRHSCDSAVGETRECFI